MATNVESKYKAKTSQELLDEQEQQKKAIEERYSTNNNEQNNASLISKAAQTILDTKGRLGIGVVSGVENIIGGTGRVLHTIGSGVKDIANYTKQGYNLPQAIKLVSMNNDTENNLKGYNDINFNKASEYLTDKLGNVTQDSVLNNNEWANKWIGGAATTIGEMLPSIALGQITGISGLQDIAFGAGASHTANKEALQEGASNKDAALYGLASGFLENATEKISGGIGFGEFGSGILGETVSSVAPEITAKLQSSVIANLVYNFFGEGIEEVASDVASPYLKRWIYDPNAPSSTNEELLDSFIMGGLCGLVMDGAYNVVGDKTKQSAQELQQLIDLQINATNNKQYEQARAIKQLVDKKLIELEGLLENEENIKTLSSLLNNENQIDLLEKYQKEYITKDNAKYQNKYENTLKELDSIVQNMGIEERSRYLKGRGLNYLYDNNTGERLEVSKDFQKKAAFANKVLKKLDESVFINYYKGNVGENGYYENGSNTVNINMNASNPFYIVGLHELTHSLEGTQEYNDLSNFIIKNYDQKSYKQSIKETRATYNKYAQKTGKKIDTSNDAMNKEFVANFISEDLLNLDKNKGIIEKLVEEQPKLAKRIANKIKSIFNKTKGLDKKFDKQALETYYLFKRAIARKQANIIIKDGNGLQFSVATYNDGGKEALIKELSKNFIKEDVNNVISQIDNIINEVTTFAKDNNFKTLSDFLDAKPVMSLVNGRPVMSCLIANGDYMLNFDFSATCKKRIEYQKVIEWLCDNNYFDNGKVLTETNIAKIQDILTSYGIETYCKLCFVEARRLHQEGWAKSAIDMWNNSVRYYYGKEYTNNNYDFGDFDFVKYYAGEISSESVDSNIKEMFEKNDIGNFKDYDYTLNTKESNFVGSAKNSSNQAKVFRIVRRLYFSGMKTPPTLTMKDLLSPKGLERVKSMSPEFFSFLKSSYGAGTPKMNYGFTPYNSEVFALTSPSFVNQTTGKTISGFKELVDKYKKTLTQERAEEEALKEICYNIGGIRFQSFSDGQITQVIDIMQLFADLSAKNYPMHMYTKESWEVYMFGLMGAKMNMSLISTLYPETNTKELGHYLAGLREVTKDNPSITNMDITIEVDVDGKPIIKNGQVIEATEKSKYTKTYTTDFITSSDIKNAIGKKYLDDKGNPIQSFPFDKAMDIISRLDYSKNCGTIAIGFSDAHVRCLLKDKRISMVIPYHASGVVKSFARKYYFDNAMSFEKGVGTTQETKVDKKSCKIINSKGESVNLTKELEKKILALVNFNFNESVQSYGNNKNAPYLATKEYIKMCKNGLKDQVLRTKNNTYIVNCKFVPKFNNFSSDPNYYKLLADFSLFDSEGNYSRQQGVTWKLPDNANDIVRNNLNVALSTEKSSNKVQEEVHNDIIKELGLKKQYSISNDTSNIQYSLVTDKKLIKKLDSEEGIKVYRAMVEIDGELYPPMATNIRDENGKKVLQPTAKIGEWVQSDEHPEIAYTVKNKKTGEVKKDKKTGEDAYFFDLLKDNGELVPARYNPYIHSSLSPLNDQFSSAYKRPNLVVVEGIAPKSELTSGYRANLAKDPVGMAEWKSGPVASKLSSVRKVMLSRYFKPLRVVSDAEVASIVAPILKKERVSLPYNVVTPTLLEELKKQGVVINEEYNKSVRYSISDMNNKDFIDFIDFDGEFIDRQYYDINDIKNNYNVDDNFHNDVKSSILIDEIDKSNHNVEDYFEYYKDIKFYYPNQDITRHTSDKKLFKDIVFNNIDVTTGPYYEEIAKEDMFKYKNGSPTYLSLFKNIIYDKYDEVKTSDEVSNIINDFEDKYRAIKKFLVKKNANKDFRTPNILDIKYQDKNELIKLRESGKSASWSEKRLNETYMYSHYQNNNSKAKSWSYYISPQEFLELTLASKDKSGGYSFVDILKATENSDEKLGELNVDELRNQSQNIMLYIGKNGEVIGHEGRHRMYALMQAGYTNVQIEVSFYYNNGYLIKDIEDVNVPSYLLGQTFQSEKGRTTSLKIPFIKEFLVPINIESYNKVLNNDSNIQYSVSKVDKVEKTQDINNTKDIPASYVTSTANYKQKVTYERQVAKELTDTIIDKIKARTNLDEIKTVKGGKNKIVNYIFQEMNKVKVEDILSGESSDNMSFIIADYIMEGLNIDNAKNVPNWILFGDESDIQISDEDVLDGIRTSIARDIQKAYLETGKIGKYAEFKQKTSDIIYNLKQELRYQKAYNVQMKRLDKNFNSLMEKVRTKSFVNNPNAEHIHTMFESLKYITKGTYGIKPNNLNSAATAYKLLQLKGEFYDSESFEKYQNAKIDKDFELLHSSLEENKNLLPSSLKYMYASRLNKDQLKAVNDIFAYLNKLVISYDDMVVNGRKTSATQFASEGIENLERVETLSKTSNLKKDPFIATLKPRQFFELMDGYYKGKKGVTPLTTLVYDTLVDADNKRYKNTMEIEGILEDFVKNNKGYLDKLHKDKVKLYNGLEIEYGQALYIYMLSRREQARGHFITDVDENAKGINFYDKNGLRTNVKFTFDQLIDLFSQLDLQGKDAEYIKCLDTMLDKAKKLKVETDIEYLGSTNALELNYVPIITDKNYNSFVKYGDARVTMHFDYVLGLGLNKNTLQGANNSIRGMNIDNVIKRHIDQVVRYNAYFVPVKNIQMVMNREVNGTTLSKQLGDKYREFDTYLDKYLKDVIDIKDIHGDSRISKASSIARGLVATASLGFNLKVMFNQLSSIPTAWSMIGENYIAKAKKYLVKDAKEQYQSMIDNSTYIKYRYYSNDSIKASGSFSALTKAQRFTMRGIEAFDKMAINNLWVATQLKVAKEQNLDFGSEENMKVASKLLEKIVRATQPNYNDTEAPSFKRSESEIDKWFGMFMTQPLQNLSTIYQGFIERRNIQKDILLSRESKNKLLQENTKMIAKNVACVTAANLMYTMIGMLFKLWMGKLKDNNDDDEVNFKDFAKQFGLDYANATVGMLPVVKDIYALIMDGYDFGGNIFSSVNDVFTGLKDIASSITSGDYNGIVYKIAKTTSSLTGLPFKNILDYAKAILGTFDPNVAYKYGTIWYGKTISQYTNDLEKAVSNKDYSKSNVIAKQIYLEKGIVIDSSNLQEINSLIKQGLSNTLIPKTMNKSFTYDGKEYNLSTSEYSKAKKKYSNILNKKLAKLIKSSKYKSLTKEERAKAIKQIQDYAYYEALGEYVNINIGTNKIKALIKAIDPSYVALVLAKTKSKDEMKKYINSLPLDKAQKYILYGMCGYSPLTDNAPTQVSNYLTSKGYSTEEVKYIMHLANLD